MDLILEDNSIFARDTSLAKKKMLLKKLFGSFNKIYKNRPIYVNFKRDFSYNEGDLNNKYIEDVKVPSVELYRSLLLNQLEEYEKDKLKEFNEV
jgi:hypothetical protein